MTDTVDTSAEAVSALVTRLGRKSSLKEHGMWCGAMDDAAATLRALLAERDALTTHRGYVTCARCGHQNGFLEADLAAEVERRAAAAYAERDAAQAEVARLRTALKRWEHYGCPDCGGDCSSANPPVMCCIMQETRAALAGDTDAK